MRNFFGREQRNYANNDNFSNDKNAHLRSLIERRCFVPLTLNDDNDIDSLIIRTHSYHKLPQQLLKLTVLKLDGSFFDVHVRRNATVAELKQAVEEVFTSSPKEDQEKISWSHVWSHFCLSYEGHKLINDKACIKKCGIKNGDKLQFVRYMSVNYSNSKRRFRDQHAARKPYSVPSSRNVHKDSEHDTTVDHSDNNGNQYYNYNYHCTDKEETSMSEFKLVHFLKGWLSYSKLQGASRKESKGQSWPSRFSFQCLGGGQRMIKLRG